MPFMSNFTGKVAIVTGATSGIGKATAIALSAAGAKVVLAGRREAEGAAVVSAIEQAGREAAFFKTDVAREKDVEALVAFTLVKFGRLDMAVNNAGVELSAATLDVTEDDYRRVFDVNVWGVLASMKHQIPAMLQTGGGAIVNTSSIAGRVGFAGASVYVASKHAVEGLTKATALEFAKQGVRVNAVTPAAIETPMLDRFASEDEIRAHMASLHPVGRFGKPEDIARAVLYLLDPANDFVTGISLAVDGGFLAQ
jgi:NAD(P)-dependent dehydrogenase (short-subunit alcohol dehydrogenase family)